MCFFFGWQLLAKMSNVTQFFGSGALNCERGERVTWNIATVTQFGATDFGAERVLRSSGCPKMDKLRIPAVFPWFLLALPTDEP